MSKGLEAFYNNILPRLKPNDIAFLDVRNAIHQVEQELKRLEEIDNVMFLNNKKCKAFDIIKEKKVNIENFIIICSKMSYEQYKFMWECGGFLGIKMTSKEFLAKDEYDLLKEALL